MDGNAIAVRETPLGPTWCFPHSIGWMETLLLSGRPLWDQPGAFRIPLDGWKRYCCPGDPSGTNLVLSAFHWMDGNAIAVREIPLGPTWCFPHSIGWMETLLLSGRSLWDQPGAFRIPLDGWK